MKSSIYIHIPFCRQKCDYCDFFSIEEKNRLGKKNDISDGYILALINEAKFYARLYDIKDWSSIYIGGGTPGILSEKQIYSLLSGVKNAVQNQTECEITVEVNPENVTEEKIEALKDSSANRISMGIQAFDDRALRAVNRKSDEKTILKALSILEKNWNGNLSVDFISGIPAQTYRSFENQFEILDEFKKINHISLYTLTIEENTPLSKKIQNGEIHFSYERADKMWLLGRNILEKKGFFQYEVSNFARPGFESIHNSSYWKQKNYIGVGSGAVGTAYDFSSQNALRWTNTLSIPKYVDFWRNFPEELKESVSVSLKTGFDLSLLPRKTENLDAKTLEFEFLMTGFRLLSGVSSKEYFSRFGKSLEKRIGAENGIFSEWKKKRLACVQINSDDKIYSLNKRGILLLNRFLEDLV